jgi:repressor LexA
MEVTLDLLAMARPVATQAAAAAVIERLAAERKVSLAALSRMLGRSSSYLWRFVNGGPPEQMSTRDGQLLAAFLRVDPRDIGVDAPAPKPKLRAGSSWPPRDFSEA